MFRGERRDVVQLVLAEAWGWLQANGLLAPHPLAGERWILTRRGREIALESAFHDYRKASSVPWDIIHPSIRDLVRTLILSGLYDSAILEAFKRVEVAVREACGYRASKDSIGTTLMNNAFRTANSSSEKNPIGRLTDISVEESEQQALRDLFAGSIGYLKNPQSHRIVGVDEVTQTVEVIMFASHLLRIVDMRKDAWDKAVAEQAYQKQCFGDDNEIMKERC